MKVPLFAAGAAGAVVAAGPVADDSSDENEDGGGAARQFKCPYCNHSGSRSTKDSHVLKHTNLYDPTKDYFYKYKTPHFVSETMSKEESHPKMNKI